MTRPAPVAPPLDIADPAGAPAYAAPGPIGGVRAGVTSTVLGNVSLFVGDPPDEVSGRRAAASAILGVDPTWWTCRAEHGARISDGTVGEADGLLLRRGGPAAAVLGADCPLVLLLGAEGAAVVHAGWRGILAGVLEAGVTALGRHTDVRTAWITPCIGPASFEVGSEVSRLFPAAHRAATSWGASSIDLPAAVIERLGARDIEAAWCGIDTYTDGRFFSHRRGARGRHALLAQVSDG